MHWMGKLALGAVAVLSSPAWADVRFIKEVSTTWNGCKYSLVVEQDTYVPPYPPFSSDYYASFRREADASGTCQLEPVSFRLTTSQAQPDVAIAADSAGLVIAYSNGGYSHGYGGESTQLSLLDPATLATLRSVRLSGAGLTPQCTAGGGGVAVAQQLTIHNHSTLVVQGRFGGNAIFFYQASEPRETSLCDGPARGFTKFTAVFPSFFTSQAAPAAYMY
ncbi:hypothetical protein [Stigmatella erecta]|uniref:Uncharacterized protein n=1 Tax=Stigmatella erecta TaxID=83460 RepID=A0A1I0FKH2_9BACT|nr:hypothetical protein [Stigmatella erecta]SET58797.1 hypothetical protein SAMN05443639_103455 [Stigmatella erecta]